MRRGVPITPNCYCCNCIKEDIFYIFWKCPKASQLWTELFNQLGCNPPNLDDMTKDNMIDVVKNWVHNKTFDNHINLEVLFVFCLWEVWNCRNGNVFNKSNSTPLFDRAYASAIRYKHLTNHLSTQYQYLLIISVKWSPLILEIPIN